MIFFYSATAGALIAIANVFIYIFVKKYSPIAIEEKPEMKFEADFWIILLTMAAIMPAIETIVGCGIIYIAIMYNINYLLSIFIVSILSYFAHSQHDILGKIIVLLLFCGMSFQFVYLLPVDGFVFAAFSVFLTHAAYNFFLFFCPYMVENYLRSANKKLNS
jgi:hypothetical protein